VRPHLATLLVDFRRHGNQIAVVSHRGNRAFPCSWAQLADRSARFANELGRRGIEAGDRVLLWGDNSAEWVAAFFGCVLRGVIAVPLDAAGATEFAHRVLTEVQPKLAVGAPQLLARLPLPRASTLTFEAFPNALPAPDYRPYPGLSRDSVLQIIFTSGTTAEPKGIVHTHGNVLASLDSLEAEIGKYLVYERFFHPLRFLHTLPLSHVFGQFMGLWVPPLLAAETHFESRLEAPRLIRIVHNERISVLAAVPRVLDLLRAHLLAEDPGSAQRIQAAAGLPVVQRWWRFRALHRRFGWKFWAFVSGGAAVPAELESFWTSAGFALIQGYGMTETTALVTLNHPFRMARGSIGRPLPGREVQIGPDGEIRVRGASIADRVWQQGRMQPRGEGWLATGDLVSRDEHGELIFAGRKSDVIVTAAGLNIHPEDLETALRRQPGVRDAVVVPLVFPLGPSPAAVLIPDAGNGYAGSDAAGGDNGSSTPYGARAVVAANRQLADFQQILYWLIWPQPDFPRTSTGKVIRRKVQAWAEQSMRGANAQTAGEASSAGTDALIDLLHQVQPASRSQAIADKDRLAEDLHLDSLAMVQLQSALETRFGIELEDGRFPEARTVGELRRLLHAKHTPRAQESQAVPGPSGSLSESPPIPATSAPAPPLPAKAAIFPRWPWSPPIRLLRIAFLEWLMRPLVALLLAPQVAGPIAFPEPSLLIANHVTAFDVAILLYALHRRDRDRVAVAMSGEILGGWRQAKAQKHTALRLLTPIAYGLVTALFNVFPLPRGAGLRRSFAHAGEALDHGYHVLVFPEGGRSPDGRLRRFEAGIGLLAQESQVPVQPIYIHGLGPLKLREQSWFRPDTVKVLFVEAMMQEPGEEPAAFARRLQNAVEALAWTAETQGGARS
jgi:long-chain acyl-CoA synthetase